ncbi:hypothetical protein [Phaeodactylibacter sp.]|uniref:hypothetical protein n=1 Tax=Phaeodactylibacter sp. TaxID=1940289 RepID=UPI0025E708B3|nr:hypothetical protein [Phaeodactylibacter sp.]MCI4650865.1 hypothetical protein [Phaeodactylibacter sp.]MCI5089822.1 hypothetical protein [Phaeodactylibacter sp.]
MKHLILLIAMAMPFLSIAQPTTAQPEIRDSLFKDAAFRGIIGDVLYEVALDEVADTSDYSISVRPFFDRYLTAPSNSRDYFVDMVATATLNNSQSVINLNGVQTIQSQVEYILKTLKIWQGPVNAYMRQKQGVYAFPYDLGGIEAQITALSDQITALQSDLSTAQTDISTVNTNLTSIQAAVDDLNTRVQAIEGQ